MAEPGSLRNLAMDALGTYVYDLCSNLTAVPPGLPVKNKSKKSKVNHNIDMQKVNQICRNLSDMIMQVPVDVANELTNKLLDSVDNWDFEIGKCKKGSVEETIYEQVIVNIIHPSVSRIEPYDDLVDCSDIFPGTIFCSPLCASLIVKNIHVFSNLQKLHLLHSNMKCFITHASFPEHLVEFSGRCSDETLSDIVSSCKGLRYLDVFGSKHVTNASIDVIMKADHLEKLNVSQTKITNTGIRKFLDTCLKSDKYLKLKYLSFSSDVFMNFNVLAKFPNLKLSLQLYASDHEVIFDLSEVSSLKNLTALQISTSQYYLNQILHEIGGQLVYLDVELQVLCPNVGSQNGIPDPQDMENFKFAEVLKIGQHCTQLKCLHISIGCYFIPDVRNFVSPILPGFQTISCLFLEVEKLNHTDMCDYFSFLISQCTNMKKLILEFDRHVYKVCNFLSNLIHMGCMKKVKLIYFKPFCDKCSKAVDNFSSSNFFSQSEVDELIQLLIKHCPHLKYIGLEPEFDRNCVHNPQRLKFSPTWCRCK